MNPTFALTMLSRLTFAPGVDSRRQTDGVKTQGDTQLPVLALRGWAD